MMQWFLLKTTIIEFIFDEDEVINLLKIIDLTEKNGTLQKIKTINKRWIKKL